MDWFGDQAIRAVPMALLLDAVRTPVQPESAGQRVGPEPEPQAQARPHREPRAPARPHRARREPMERQAAKEPLRPVPESPEPRAPPMGQVRLAETPRVRTEPAR